MPEFRTIETQEEFDKAISDRLKRERETVEKKYEGYLSPEEATEKYKDYLSPEDVSKKYKGYISPEEDAEKEKKIKKYESDSVKTRIAHEMGFSYDAVGFLKGENEQEIKESAESLKALLGEKHHETPMFRTEPAGDGKEEAEKEAFKSMLADMKGE